MARWVEGAIGRLPTIAVDMELKWYAKLYILTTSRCIGGQLIEC
jgi:hypothetical protein